MITASQFVRYEGGTGRLILGLFPGYTQMALTGRIQDLITAAYLHPTVAAASPGTEQDVLASAYVYEQAYDEALLLAATRPTEIRMERLGTRKMDVAALIRLLEKWRDDAAGVLNGTTAAEAADLSSTTATVVIHPA
jgi:hypothetical protein